MVAALMSSLSISSLNPSKTLSILIPENPLPNLWVSFKSCRLQSRTFLRARSSPILHRCASVSGKNLPAAPSGTRNYEFSDGGTEVELRVDISAFGVESSRDIFVDADDSSLLIRVKTSGTLRTLMQTDCLFERVKPAETIWYIDEDQLVVNLKKREAELKWPDVMESWESLVLAAPQLLKGTSIYVVGESTEINQEVAKVIAVGIGYTPLCTSELLEKCAEQSVDSWVAAEGAGPVAEAEALALQSLSSHVRAVVATLGGLHGAAAWHDKWRHLHAGFTVWISKSRAAGKDFSMPISQVYSWKQNFPEQRKEAITNMEDGGLAYTNADVVVKLSGWDKNHAEEVALGCLRALKQLVLSDKQLTGKKSLYIRLGCRGDWPNIKPPGWDPSSEN